MNKNVKTIGAKPIGMLGRISGNIMNIFHSVQYNKIINKHILPLVLKQVGLMVLDIGCGGGVSLKHFSKSRDVNQVHGIDYSRDMVKLSEKVNRKVNSLRKVKVMQASVLDLPFKDGTYDIIGAFDTVNFWSDYQKSINEIIRVLKNSGFFFIINAYPKEGTKWYDFVYFKNFQEYKDLLLKNGFRNVNFTFYNSNKTIIVWGQK
jgi:ubiquinone/menaquinone biosynthesis C-methylase UbiE